MATYNECSRSLGELRCGDRCRRARDAHESQSLREQKEIHRQSTADEEEQSSKRLHVGFGERKSRLDSEARGMILHREKMQRAVQNHPIRWTCRKRACFDPCWCATKNLFRRVTPYPLGQPGRKTRPGTRTRNLNLYSCHRSSCATFNDLIISKAVTYRMR